MKTNLTPTVLALAFAFSGLMSNRADAILAYQIPASPGYANSNIQTGGPYILGNKFVVNSPVNVDAIGAFDHLSNGFASPVNVAIYRLTGSAWNQVTGTLKSFTGTDSEYTDGGFGFKYLSSAVQLGTGTYAVVGAGFAVTGAETWNRNLDLTTPAVQGLTFQTASTDVSMAGGNFSFYAGGSTLAPTLGAVNDGSWGTPLPTFGAGSFDFSPVPEPGSFGFLAAGLLGTVSMGRFMRRKR